MVSAVRNCTEAFCLFIFLIRVVLGLCLSDPNSPMTISFIPLERGGERERGRRQTPRHASPVQAHVTSRLGIPGGAHLLLGLHCAGLHCASCAASSLLFRLGRSYSRELLQLWKERELECSVAIFQMQHWADSSCLVAFGVFP